MKSSFEATREWIGVPVSNFGLIRGPIVMYYEILDSILAQRANLDLKMH